MNSCLLLCAQLLLLLRALALNFAIVRIVRTFIIRIQIAWVNKFEQHLQQCPSIFFNILRPLVSVSLLISFEVQLVTKCFGSKYQVRVFLMFLDVEFSTLWCPIGCALEIKFRRRLHAEVVGR